MAPKDELHPHVAFALRHGSRTNQFFNAASAIARLEGLIADARQLQSILDQVEPEKRYRFPLMGTELVSYYAVGYVTCLEWHARSRTVDLFDYKPDAIKSIDIQAARLGDKVVPQMISHNTTVPQLIGASINISSFHAYMSLLSRLFIELNFNTDPHKSLTEPSTGTPFLSGTDFERLETLFTFRNSLTHEIAIDTIGHPNIRSAWSTATAIEYGELVRSVLKGIERAMLQHAPADFPNLVRDDGFPVRKLDMLKTHIRELETKLELFFKDQSNIEYDLLTKALNAAKERIDLESEFIIASRILHCRYIDLKEPLLELLLESRANYLEALLKTIS